MVSDARYFKQYLYMMTFPNGMVYVGTAYDINKRWANRGNAYRSQKVWAAIREFGWENIKKEILMYIPCGNDGWSSSKKIRDKERELIKEYDGRSYNVQCTKEGGNAIADATRATGVYERNRKKTGHP